MEHDYRIDGHINGRHVLGIGAGSIDPGSGTCELEVDFAQLPEGWDPRTIPLLGCDRSLLMSPVEHGGAVGIDRASRGHVTIGRDLVDAMRSGTMRDDAGQIVVSARGTSITDFGNDRRYDSARIEGGVSHLRPGENGIARIRSLTGVMLQTGPGVIAVTTSYEVLLEDGSVLHGVTYDPHRLPFQEVELPTVQRLRVNVVEQELDGARLWMKTVSRVSPMVDRPVAAAQPQLATA